MQSTHSSAVIEPKQWKQIVRPYLPIECNTNLYQIKLSQNYLQMQSKSK